MQTQDPDRTPRQNRRHLAFLGDLMDARRAAEAGRPVPEAVAQRLLVQPVSVQIPLADAFSRHDDARGYDES
jgi:hypothetical protein